MRKSMLSLLFLCGYLLSNIASANLALSDYRLYFDNRNKSNSLLVRNTSNDTLQYTVQIIHKDMTETGIFFSVDDKQVKSRSAKKMLRYSPRRGIIKAQELQAIRFSLRKPANLPAGEYRAFLKITSQIINHNKNAGVNISPRLSYNVPIIVRHGKTEAASSIENPHLIMQNSQPTVQFWQTLSGNRSLYGDFVIYDENDLEVGRLNSVAVYLPLSRRKINIPLSSEAKGKLLIKYKEQQKYGGNIELTANINIK